MTDHPELRRIMLPHNWVGHPLRKNYAIGGEPVQFTVNPDDPSLSSLGQQVMDAPTGESDVPPWFSGRKDTMIINMGPQHPSTHGVLRLLLRTDGEVVYEVTPHIGYLHRCAEKIGENLTGPSVK